MPCRLNLRLLLNRTLVALVCAACPAVAHAWDYTEISVIDPVIVPAFHFDTILLSLFFIVLIGTISSLYPAFRASKLDVAEAMKFEQ